jgi:hypothetical protein
MRPLIVLLATCTFSSSAIAALIDCGSLSIDKLIVQADRSNGSSFANKVVVKMGADKHANCAAITYAYLENTDEAYSGILSTLLAARVAERPVRITVDDASGDPDKKRIEFVEIQ